MYHVDLKQYSTEKERKHNNQVSLWIEEYAACIVHVKTHIFPGRVCISAVDHTIRIVFHMQGVYANFAYHFVFGAVHRARATVIWDFFFAEMSLGSFRVAEMVTAQTKIASQIIRLF